MKKIPVVYNLDQAFYMKLMLGDALAQIQNIESTERTRIMTLAILAELHRKFTLLVFRGAARNRMNLSLYQAQAIVIAVENGWLFASHNDDYAKNTLTLTYNLLHQKTS